MRKRNKKIEEIKLICGACLTENKIEPPKKYLKKTCHIEFNCIFCGKFNLVSFIYNKLEGIDIKQVK